MVKGLERVSWGQPEVKLLRNALWLPEVIRGQPEGNCLAMVPGGGTQYKSGYRDVPQTWVAKSGRQVHQWVLFFSKTWYFDGSIFQNFLKFAPKWRKFGTLIGQRFKIFRNLRQNGANFSEKFWFLVHGWVTFPSKWVHGWVAFQKSQRHTPTQTKVEYPPRGNGRAIKCSQCYIQNIMRPQVL